jgi:RNA-directed DNA polymerase
MKRVGNLYHLIYDIENIKLAHKNARKGKTHYKEVKLVDSDVDYYCNLIHEMLVNRTFVNSPYEVFTKVDKGKEREIYKLPYFPDRIIHHAILQILEPIWKKTFINNTYQSIKGRGVHKAKKDLDKVIASYNGDVYYLQMDIKKFYPSVDNNIMMQLVSKKIKCKGTLWLLGVIIHSTKGLPIGNYLSQYLGNLYVTYLDHYVKEVMRVKHYYRYCDDIVVISADIVLLHSIHLVVKSLLLQELKLSLKDSSKITHISNGLDFLGFVFLGTHVRLRKSIAEGFKASTIKFIRNNDMQNFTSAMSYYGWVKVSNSYNLWNSCINSKFILLALGLGLNNKLLRGSRHES